MTLPSIRQIRELLNYIVSPSDGTKVLTNRGEFERYGFLHQATVTLDNDQIINLPLTSVEILAAPGTNKAIFSQFISLHMKWVADYGNIDSTAHVQVDTSAAYTTILREDTLSGVSALFAGGGPDGTWIPVIMQQLAKSANATNPHIHNGVADSGSYDADVINKPLTISMLNGGAGILTDGHADNELQISVAYYVLNTVTGEFE